MSEMKWQECLKALEDIDKEWADKVVKNQKIENYELGQKLMEFLNVLKDMAKIENGLPEEVKTVLKSDENLIKWVEAWIENALQGYRGFAPIRDLADEDEEVVRNLLRAVFDNYVLRYDPKFVDKYVTYKLKRDEMVKVLQLMDSLTDYYIISHMTKSAICDDFANETGLTDNLCDFYAVLVEENYYLLLMNYIAESFADVRRREPFV